MKLLFFVPDFSGKPFQPEKGWTLPERSTLKYYISKLSVLPMSIRVALKKLAKDKHSYLFCPDLKKRKI